MITKPTHGDPTRVGTADTAGVQSPVMHGGQESKAHTRRDSGAVACAGPAMSDCSTCIYNMSLPRDLRCGPLGDGSWVCLEPKKLAVHLLCGSY